MSNSSLAGNYFAIGQRAVVAEGQDREHPIPTTHRAILTMDTFWGPAMAHLRVVGFPSRTAHAADQVLDTIVGVELTLFARGPRGRELLGAMSGVSSTVTGFSARTSPGWGDGEATRIAGVAGSGAWVLITHDVSVERTTLLEAIKRRGLSVTTIREDRRGSLWWVQGPTPRRE